jgi:acetyl esterase/lipase
MKLPLIAIAALVLVRPVDAQNAPDNPPPQGKPLPIPSAIAEVWPEGKMPGPGAKDAEADVQGRSDGFHRITNISRPTLSLFPAPKKGAPAPTMIVCPGGGYAYVVYDKEGTEIAEWLNANGINALVLKYRTPSNRDGALRDLQRSLSVARAHAAEWNIDPKQLGVIGFSAGGNLAAKASAPLEERGYPAVDAADAKSCRPDFAVLVYPAYLSDKGGHVAPDLNLKANIPPTLIVHTEDDMAFVPGSKVYHAALDEAKVPNQFLLYPTGGHGYGLHCTKDARVWPQAALEWLQKVGIR